MPGNDLLISRISRLSEIVGSRLLVIDSKLVTVESCTGGGIAHYITTVSGSSGWFERGLVTYSNQAKTDLADVPSGLIDACGAVSIEVAEAMAKGGLQNSPGDYSISVTGIAGPDGGSPDKPVGTVCFACARRLGAETSIIRSEKIWFDGDRASVRNQSIAHGLQTIAELLE
jgi:nicotinamide-nucleotide amidase